MNKLVSEKINTNGKIKRMKILQRYRRKNNLKYLYFKYKKQSESNRNIYKTLKHKKITRKKPITISLLTNLRFQSSNQSYLQFKKKFQHFVSKQILNQKINELICPICMELCVNIISTVCGHSFCQICLQQSLLYSPNCAICKTLIRDTQNNICLTLKKLIQRYNQKIHQLKNKNIKREKEIHNNGENQDLQIKVTSRKVTQSIFGIVNIFGVQVRLYNLIKQILIEYTKWKNIYNQIISVNSNRLAPFGFYTKRTDIPRYQFKRNQIYIKIGQQQIQFNGQLNNQYIFDIREPIQDNDSNEQCDQDEDREDIMTQNNQANINSNANNNNIFNTNNTNYTNSTMHSTYTNQIYINTNNQQTTGKMLLEYLLKNMKYMQSQRRNILARMSTGQQNNMQQILNNNQQQQQQQQNTSQNQ